MSKYNNVNPGQYKTAGRERPNKLAEVRQRELQREVRGQKRDSAKKRRSKTGQKNAR